MLEAFHRLQDAAKLWRITLFQLFSDRGSHAMFYPLERLINLSEGYRQTFKVAGRDLLLMVVDNQPLLLEDSCPHQGAPLRTATLVGTVLRCQRHGIEFQLPSGRALQPACPNLKMFALVYDSDRIGIDV